MSKVLTPLITFYSLLILISACECNTDGSVNELCDDNGRCTCNDHVVGDKCDACATGYGDFSGCDYCLDTYHGYPNCIGNYELQS